MKLCKKCNKMLPYENFGKCKNVKDGYDNTCKSCRTEQRKKYTIICETCGKEHKTAYPNSRYCSPKCKPQSVRKRVKVKCFICGKEKEVTPSHKYMYKHFYCSEECKNKGYSKLYSGENSKRYSRVKIKCCVCGKEFTVNKYEFENNKVNYCSNQCRNKDFIKRFSGENNPNYDKSKSEYDREVNRNIIGYNNWRREVFKRDNFTCQCCGDKKGGNLRSHHIFNYMENKEKRIDVENGITLCDKCHKLFHDTYGYKHNNLLQITEFLNKYANTEPSIKGNFNEGVETR